MSQIGDQHSQQKLKRKSLTRRISGNKTLKNKVKFLGKTLKLLVKKTHVEKTYC